MVKLILIQEDNNTIYGVSFGHKGETPGLGAEIETNAFQEQFKGKKILEDDGSFVSVRVMKGGAAPGNPHQVDAISGATVTSRGVSEMLQKTVGHYMPYFNNMNEN